MQNPLSEVILIIVGSSVVLLVLSGFIVFALLTSQKRKFLHAKQITDIQDNFEREVLKTQIETQLQTFETISQELHDNVGTMVSIAIVQLKTISSRETLNHPETNNLLESQKILEEALDILRDISRSIDPDTITSLGLTHSFQNEIDRIKRTRSMKPSYLVDGNEFPISPPHQVIIFRIVQEALNNILKHARASELTLNVNFHDPELGIMIHDNGQGFAVDNYADTYGKSAGLVNMRKRASIINGTLEIKSEKNQGTEIQFSYRKSD